MEKIYSYIEKLLAEYHYAIIPDLGGFVVQMQSAVILHNKITPPQFYLSFNPLLCHSDGMLAIEISRTEDVSYRQAMAQIENFVERIKNELKQKGIVQVGNLGTLHKLNDGQLLFTPTKNNSFLPENLGLTDVYFHQKNNSVSSTVSFSPISFSQKVFRYAAIGVLLLGISFFSSTPKKDQKEIVQANYASFSFLFDTNKDKLIAQETEEKSDNIEEETEFIKKNFHLIVASFKTKKAAENMYEKLKNSDYANASLLYSSNIYKVAIESFATQKEALEQMKIIRREIKSFEEAWVFCE